MTHLTLLHLGWNNLRGVAPNTGSNDALFCDQQSLDWLLYGAAGFVSGSWIYLCTLCQSYSSGNLCAYGQSYSRVMC